MRGTILIVGRKDRSIELLAARLEKEHYTVMVNEPCAHVVRELRKHHPVAVLCSNSCGRGYIAKIASCTRRNPKTRNSPVIVVCDHELSPEIRQVRDVGEVFRLHQIPLVEAVRRLELAINLMHLSFAD